MNKHVKKLFTGGNNNNGSRKRNNALRGNKAPNHNASGINIGDKVVLSEKWRETHELIRSLGEIPGQIVGTVISKEGNNNNILMVEANGKKGVYFPELITKSNTPINNTKLKFVNKVFGIKNPDGAYSGKKGILKSWNDINVWLVELEDGDRKLIPGDQLFDFDTMPASGSTAMNLYENANTPEPGATAMDLYEGGARSLGRRRRSRRHTRRRN